MCRLTRLVVGQISRAGSTLVSQPPSRWRRGGSGTSWGEGDDRWIPWTTGRALRSGRLGVQSMDGAVWVFVFVARTVVQTEENNANNKKIIQIYQVLEGSGRIWEIRFKAWTVTVWVFTARTVVKKRKTMQIIFKIIHNTLTSHTEERMTRKHKNINYCCLVQFD